MSGVLDSEAATARGSARRSGRRTALFSQNECAAEVKVESLPFRVILSDEVDCCLNVWERLAIRNVSGEELLYL